VEHGKQRYLADLADADLPIVPTDFVEPACRLCPPDGRSWPMAVSA
jgi:hypothetical protein